MNYNIYINLKNFKNNLFSNFLKSLLSFFVRSKSEIISIIDFGNIFISKKNINRIFYMKVHCKKTVLIKIPKLFKIKRDIINIFLILKEKICSYLLNLNLLKKYISKDFKILPSIINKLNYKHQKKISKIIKKIKKMKIIPNTFLIFINKINNKL